MWCSLAAAEALGRAELWGCERHACRRRLSKPASRNPMTLGWPGCGIAGNELLCCFRVEVRYLSSLSASAERVPIVRGSVIPTVDCFLGRSADVRVVPARKCPKYSKKGLDPAARFHNNR